MSAEATATETPAAESTPVAESGVVDEMQAALDAITAADGGEPEKPAAEAKKSEKSEKGDAAPEEKPEVGRTWAAVRKREQKVLQERKALEARSQEIEANSKAIAEKLKQLEQRESDFDADPVAFLSKKGVTFDDLARRYLNDGKATPEEVARRSSVQQDAAAKAMQERLERLEATLEQRSIDDVVSKYRSSIASEIASPDFELLRAHPDAESEVFEFAAKYAQKHGKALTVREAAETLQREMKGYLTGLSSHEVVRSLLAANGNGGQTKQDVRGQSQVSRGQSGSSPKTLTNNLAATPPATEPDLDSLSEDEAIQAALRLVQG